MICQNLLENTELYQNITKTILEYIREEQDLLEILDLELLMVKILILILLDAFFLS